MASITVTYTFANSTTADATQVNQNFTDIINGTSDGTKDFSINALTCAGAATLNGNVTLGNASSDTLTITASLASTIPIGTTYSYDIGSSTIGLRSIYLGDAGSAARATRLIGATVASGYTFTLPTSGGTVGQHLTTDGSGTTSWRYADKTTAKTTTYTATGDETLITCDATSAAFTVTLPAAASFTGKRYVIKKIDSSVNAITIDPNGAELVDGASTTTLNTQYEAVEIVCDGSNWHIVQRTYPVAWSSSLTFTPASAAFGTISNSDFKWRRVGDSMEVLGYFTTGTVAANAAAIDLPTGYTMDTTKLITSTGSRVSTVGRFQSQVTSASSTTIDSTDHDGILFYDGSDNNTIFFAITMSSNSFAKNNGNGIFTSGDGVTVRFLVPISGWKG